MVERYTHKQGFSPLCCDIFGLLENQFLCNNNNKGSQSNVNKHELVYGESSSNAEMHQCLFIICVIVYNLYYCCYAKTSSPATQKRHSKVYGNPIAPSLYSILLGMVYGQFKLNQMLCQYGIWLVQIELDVVSVWYMVSSN